jgi:hypothetical protein
VSPPAVLSPTSIEHECSLEFLVVAFFGQLKLSNILVSLGSDHPDESNTSASVKFWFVVSLCTNRVLYHISGVSDCW